MISDQLKDFNSNLVASEGCVSWRSSESGGCPGPAQGAIATNVAPAHPEVQNVDSSEFAALKANGVVARLAVTERKFLKFACPQNHSHISMKVAN